MAEQDSLKTAIEHAARAVYEQQKGAGSWASAKPDSRSQARQSVRLVMAAFAKNGVDIQPRTSGPKVIRVAPMRAGASR